MGELSERNVESFLPYFLYFTKSRKRTATRWRKSTRSVPSRQGHCREAAKGFNFVSAKPPLRRAESRFEKPRKVSKGFNFVCAKLLLQRVESRFAEPRFFLRGRTDCHFLRRAKSNQKARGTPSCDLDSNLRSIRDFG